MHASLLLGSCYLSSLVLGQSPEAAQDATAEALVYGFPLTQYAMLASRLLHSPLGANTFNHAQDLSTPDDRSVVKPNVDTLYSTLIYDLSDADVIINIPEIPDDQFHLVSYFDPFGNNFANTGAANFNNAGQYRLRRLPERTSDVGLVTQDTGQYEAFINSPTAYGLVLIRWLVDATNLDAIHQYQLQTSSENDTHANGLASIPDLVDLFDFLQSQADETPAVTPNGTQQTMRLLTAFSSYCPPQNASDVERLNGVLSEAGIANEAYNRPEGIDLGAANSTAVQAAAASFSEPGVLQELNNGWSMVAPEFTGNFGTNYGIRATVAKSGYLMLRAPNAIYPTWSNTSEDSSGGGLSGATQTLRAGESLLYDFVGGRPPLNQAGFWSLTVYGADNFLIDNPRDVYALGDRSSLRYPDGSRVYGDPSDPAGTRAFQILVQAADNPPPTNWTSNWLPGPARRGDLQVLLRLFEAADPMLDGTYQFPTVRKVAAITPKPPASSSASATSSEGSSPTKTGSGSAETTTDQGGQLSIKWWFTTLITAMVTYLGA